MFPFGDLTAFLVSHFITHHSFL